MRLHYSLVFVLSLSIVFWILNCSLEVDLSKELTAPVNHNVDQQIEAETDVRYLSLLLNFPWVLYLKDLTSYDISSMFTYNFLPLLRSIWEKKKGVYNNIMLYIDFNCDSISLFFEWNGDQVIESKRVRWKLVPTRREQEKWDKATKAATGGSVSIVMLSSNPVPFIH